MAYDFNSLGNVGEEQSANSLYYKDYTHITDTIPEIESGIKDNVSVTLAQWIRQKQYGIDVREALALFVEWISVRTTDAEKGNEIVTNQQNNLSVLVNDFMADFTNRYNTQIAGNTSLNEVIDARLSPKYGPYQTLNERLTHIENSKQDSNSKEFDLLEYGLIPDDITKMEHNNSLFVEILQYQGSLKIKVPTNHRFYIGDITCGRGNIDIYGGGSLTINMHFVSENIKSYVNISDVTFEYDSVQPTNLPLQFQRTTRGSIKKCQFKNCHKAISYDSLDSAQHFSRFVIDGNYFLGVDYALYGERQAGGQQPLISADIHFTNNIVEECYITHVHVEGFDGGVISNNTFFFPSSMRHSTDKKYNIYINYCDWTVISNNNLFEAGLDAVHVEHGQHLNIIGNNIAWCGQRLGGSGIKLVNLDNAGGRFNISNISNNIIMYPTESGVYLNNVGHIAVDGNNIFGAGNTTYFYGDKSVLGSLEKWGIYLGTSSERVTATANLCTQNAINNLNSAKNIVKNNMTADSSGTTFDVSKSEFTVTVASGNRVGTAGTNIPANKILSATLIYSDDVFNNVATPCINTDGSLSVVTSSAVSANRSYKVRVSLLN